MEKEGNIGFLGRLPSRYVFGILSFFAVFIQYSMKLGIVVGINSMAKKYEIRSTDQCPQPIQSNEIENSSETFEPEFDWNQVEKERVLLFHYIGYMCTQFLGGYLSQKFGGRWVVGPAVFTTGICSIMTVFAARTNFTVLLFTRLMSGCASGLVLPSLHVMFSRWFPIKERQKFAGFVFTSVHLGSVAGMIIAGLLCFYWPAIFFFNGAMGILWLIPWYLLAYDSPFLHPRITSKEKQYIIEGLGLDRKKGFKVPKRIPWRKIVTSGPIWASIVFHSGSVWIMYVAFTQSAIYLIDILRFGVQQSGLISSIPFLMGWFSGVISANIAQRLRNLGVWSHLKAYMICNAFSNLAASGCFLIIIVARCEMTTNVLMFVLVMFFNAMIHGGSYLNYMDLAVNHAGVITGILHTVINTFGFVTSLVKQALITNDNTIRSWQIYFGITIVIAWITFIIYAMFGSVEEQPWNSYGMEDSDDETDNDAPGDGIGGDKALTKDLKKEVKIPKKNFRTSKFLE